jgi:hypothetical protein
VFCLIPITPLALPAEVTSAVPGIKKNRRDVSRFVAYSLILFSFNRCAFIPDRNVKDQQINLPEILGSRNSSLLRDDMLPIQ